MEKNERQSIDFESFFIVTLLSVNETLKSLLSRIFTKRNFSTVFGSSPSVVTKTLTLICDGKLPVVKLIPSRTLKIDPLNNSNGSLAELNGFKTTLVIGRRPAAKSKAPKFPIGTFVGESLRISIESTVLLFNVNV